jgi:RimJ/RimL family protein N-acetyltransferase
MRNLPLPIVGKKITIRRLYLRDLRPLYKLEADEEVKRYVGGAITTRQQEWIDGMRRRLSDPESILPLAVLRKDSLTFAGRATLFPKDGERRCWELQVLIAKMYWGQRLGRDVAEHLIDVVFSHPGAACLIATVHPENTASRALVDSFGFKQVETKRTAGWDYGHLVFQLSADRDPAG